MPEKYEKCPFQFPRAKTDMFRLVVLSDQQYKIHLREWNQKIFGMID